MKLHHRQATLCCLVCTASRHTHTHTQAWRPSTHAAFLVDPHFRSACLSKGEMIRSMYFSLFMIHSLIDAWGEWNGEEDSRKRVCAQPVCLPFFPPPLPPFEWTRTKK
jgi:hypothetical protein